jgi:hypothetical protein
MSFVSTISRFGVRLVVPFLLLYAFAGRIRRAWNGRPAATRAARERSVLPSLYDLHPEASTPMRRPRGLQTVALEEIVGTARHPSQNTADFLPLPQLRGQNWRGRWQRIRRATDRLTLLPPVELLRFGDEYFVVDGHNRIAAALREGAVAIDADVTELVPPGQQPHGTPPTTIAPTLQASDQLRLAAGGRQSRTAEYRNRADEVSRRDLLRASGDNPRAAGEETDVHESVQAPGSPGGGQAPE